VCQSYIVYIDSVWNNWSTLIFCVIKTSTHHGTFNRTRAHDSVNCWTLCTNNNNIITKMHLVWSLHSLNTEVIISRPWLILLRLAAQTTFLWLTKATQRCTKLPRECSSNWTHLENTSGQRFTIIQWWRMWQLHQPYQLASDACRGASTAWRHNHTNTRVTTATHCTTAGIHYETHQESTICKQAHLATVLILSMSNRTRAHAPLCSDNALMQYRISNSHKQKNMAQKTCVLCTKLPLNVLLK